jgi:hypothetical protein
MTRRYPPQSQRPTIPDFPLDPNDNRPVHVELIYEPRPDPWLSPAEPPTRASDAAPSFSAPQIPTSATAALSRALDLLAKSGEAAPALAAEAVPTESRRKPAPRRNSQTRRSTSRQPLTTTGHLINRFRQGTALAVPIGAEKSGVLTPEVSGANALPGCETRSRQSPLVSSHHSRHCTVCRHPEREAIEEDFIHWHPPRHIATDYKITTRALNRHAHAAGLFSLRDRKLRFALGHIVERAMDVTPTADSIIRAVQAYTRVNDSGQWVELPTHVIVSSGTAIRADRAVPDSSRPAFEPPPSGTELPALPVTACRVENDSTR